MVEDYRFCLCYSFIREGSLEPEIGFINITTDKEFRIVHENARDGVAGLDLIEPKNNWFICNTKARIIVSPIDFDKDSPENIREAMLNESATKKGTRFNSSINSETT